jgi:hypothetical protein
MASGVNNGSDYYKALFVDDFVDYTVRKAPWVTPTNVLGWMPAAMQEWIYRQLIKHRQSLFDEFVSQTGSLVVIPIRRLGYVVFRLGSRNDFPFHDFDRERRRFFKSSRDTEELGSE